MKTRKKVKLNPNETVSIDYCTPNGTRKRRTILLMGPQLITWEITLRRFENEKV